MTELWVPIIAIITPVLAVAIVFYFKLQTQRMVHQERLAMIEKGITPADINMEQLVEAANKPVNAQRNLTSGIVTTLVGLAILIGLSSIGSGPWLLGGLIPMAVGIGQVIAYVISIPKSGEDRDSNK